MPPQVLRSSRYVRFLTCPLRPSALLVIIPGYFVLGPPGPGHRRGLWVVWPDQLHSRQRPEKNSVCNQRGGSRLYSSEVRPRKSSKQGHGADCDGPGWWRYNSFKCSVCGL